MNTFDRIKELLKFTKPELDASELSRKDCLKSDLGLDSLDISMLIIVIEDEFNLSVVKDLNLITVGDICDYIDDVRCTN